MAELPGLQGRTTALEPWRRLLGSSLEAAMPPTLAVRTIVFSINYPAEERSIAAVLAEADGRAADALAAFAEAALAWRGLGNPYETAMAELGAGRCLVALGRPREAATHLSEARMTFAELGAAPVLAEADRRLALLREGGYRDVVSVTDP